MKIVLLLTDISNDGGVQNTVVQLANYLYSKKYNVQILSVMHSNKTNKNINNLNSNIIINYLIDDKVNFKKNFLKISFLLIKKFKKLNPDYVIASGIFYSLPLLSFYKKYKLIIWAHSSYSSAKVFGMDWFGRYVSYLTAHKIVAITSRDFLKLKNNKFNFKKSKVELIYNSINHDYKNVYNLNSKKIISIGSITHIKGFDRIIELGNDLFEKIPDWQWYIFGDGVEIDNYIEEVNRKNLNKKIYFKGHIDNIYNEFEDCGIFVCTSRSEGFGLVNLEAKMSGVPVISFELNGITKEIIQDNLNGFIIPDNDIEKLKEKIIELANNITLRQKFSENTSLDNKKFYNEINFRKWEELFMKG